MDSLHNKVIDVKIEEEMQKILYRLRYECHCKRIPDVRDGLKPVHEEFYIQSYELGLTPDKGFRKSARIVGMYWVSIIPMVILQYMMPW